MGAGGGEESMAGISDVEYIDALFFIGRKYLWEQKDGGEGKMTKGKGRLGVRVTGGGEGYKGRGTCMGMGRGGLLESSTSENCPLGNSRGHKLDALVKHIQKRCITITSG